MKSWGGGGGAETEAVRVGGEGGGLKKAVGLRKKLGGGGRGLLREKLGLWV